MTLRDVSTRLSLVVTLVVAGCYDPPKPACGFRCGPAAACPGEYTCAADGRCHLDGSPADLICAVVDAGIDAPDDGPPDAFSPAVVEITPINGSTGVQQFDTVSVRFDVDVIGVDDTSFLVTADAVPVTGTVVYSSVTHGATFTTPEGLPANASIGVSLSSGITDPISARAIMPVTWTFATGPDITPPAVAQTTPPSNTTGIAVDANLVVRFSEQVLNVTTATFTLTGGAAITGVVTYDNPTRTATFDPIDQLAPNQLHTGSLTAGVTDLATNPLFNAPFVTSFTTGADTIVPAVRVTSPANNDANVAVNTDIVVTFDEPVQNVDTASFTVNGGAVAGTVTMSNGNKTATFDPTADLPAASTITVDLSAAITDGSANALGATTFTFTTL